MPAGYCLSWGWYPKSSSRVPALGLQIKALNVPASDDFDFALFLADPSDVRDWNIAGLPADSFSTENGVMVTRGRRWPLMIDPQVRHGRFIV